MAIELTMVDAADNDFDSDLSDLQRLHQREYKVHSYVLDNENILLRGRVKDIKPPGVYFCLLYTSDAADE